MRRSLLLAAALVLLGVTPAWAHVSVTPDEAARGATVTFTFTVPNEEAPATTSAVEIVWPDTVTFDGVAPEEKPGWTVTTTAHSVTWSGGAISGTAKEPFTLTVGPMPNGDTVAFKVVQTYSDGQVARWIDLPSGSGEPDHPAPVVALTGTPVTTVTSTTSTKAASQTTSGGDTENDDDGGGGGGVTALIVGAFVLAGIGGGIALSARRRAAQP